MEEEPVHPLNIPDVLYGIFTVLVRMGAAEWYRGIRVCRLFHAFGIRPIIRNKVKKVVWTERITAYLTHGGMRTPVQTVLLTCEQRGKHAISYVGYLDDDETKAVRKCLFWISNGKVYGPRYDQHTGKTMFDGEVRYRTWCGFAKLTVDVVTSMQSVEKDAMAMFKAHAQ